MPIETRKKLSKPPFKRFLQQRQQTFPEVFSARCAENSHDDRLHGSEVRSSPCMKTVVHGNEDGRQRDEDGRHERAAGLPETGLFIRSIFLHHPQAGSGYSTLRKLRFSGLSRKTRFGLTKTHVPETNRANVLSARHKMFRPAYKKTTRKGSVSGLK